MCGRYITPDERALRQLWSDLPFGYEYRQSWNFAPTQTGPVVVSQQAPDDERATPRLRLMKWGFQPRWSSRGWINARAETAFESRAFRYAIRHQRCLVPAAGWYEWTGNTKPRQPWLFTRADGAPFAFAGIWTSPETAVDTYAILTTAPNELAAPIHNRMPFVVPPEAYATWLDEAASLEDLQSVLQRPHGESFEVYPVSTAVNTPRNNWPELAERIAV